MRFCQGAGAAVWLPSGQVPAGRDGVAAAVRCGPDQGAGLGLGEGPAGCLLGSVVPSAKGCQVAETGPAALLPGGGVVEVAVLSGAAAAGRGAGPVAYPDAVADQGGGPVAGYLGGVLAGGVVEAGVCQP